MFRSLRFAVGVAAAAVVALTSAPLLAAPVGTAFTYQGELVKGGVPYQGSADFIFRLHNVASGAGQVGSDVTIAGVQVPAGGLFTVSLDFGAVFNGTALWLEVQVKTPGDGSYTTLTPRQPLTAAPFALYSLAGTPNQWVTDANGIEFAGSVGIGQASTPIRLTVNGGSGRNAGYFTNSDPDFASLFVRNFGANGFGLYDDTSGRHYFSGSLGLRTTSPRAPIESVGGTVGVWGIGKGNTIVAGYQAGVYGEGQKGTGTFGVDAAGVIGASGGGYGVQGITTTGISGVTGQNNTSGNIGYLGGAAAAVQGNAVSSSSFGGYFANSAGGGVALKADGLAQVKTLQILGADLAESFPVAGQEPVEPGTVLALGDGQDGELKVADEAYSRRVAGVVSGANGLNAGVVLKGDSFEGAGQAAVALSGRVWVKCDASKAPIRVGDLLTTAERPGHAMVATDRDRGLGAILGKAMSTLETGTGMVLVLVSLQ